VNSNQVKCKFSARWPGEYDASQPMLSDIFSGEVFISGPTNYFLASRIARIKGVDELQWVRCYLATDDNIRGQTPPYEILNHAPNAFLLNNPVDHAIMYLQHAVDQERFDWQKAVPQDPYSNITISRFLPPTGTNLGNDLVTYTVTFVDSMSLTRAVKFDSDNSGKEVTYTTNHGQLSALIGSISGQPDPTTGAKMYNVVWFVEATDVLYKTLSNPPNGDPSLRPGHHLFIEKKGILSADGPAPAEYALSQNYPNPFNPTTSISYSLPSASQVTLMVFDLLGAPVKTLVNTKLEPGTYTVNWDATNDAGMQMPSGNYIIKIVAGSFTQTRKMTLMK